MCLVLIRPEPVSTTARKAFTGYETFPAGYHTVIHEMRGLLLFLIILLSAFFDGFSRIAYASPLHEA